MQISRRRNDDEDAEVRAHLNPHPSTRARSTARRSARKTLSRWIPHHFSRGRATRAKGVRARLAPSPATPTTSARRVTPPTVSLFRRDGPGRARDSRADWRDFATRDEPFGPLIRILTSRSPLPSPLSSLVSQEDLYSYVTVVDTPEGFSGLGTKVVDDV